MPLAAASRLGPYEILAPLGAGGMGEVYRARDTRLGREVALKVLAEVRRDDPDALRRFEIEARAASALAHPGILAVFDVGSDGGIEYLVTELLRGESLRERIARGPLPPRKAVEIVAAVADALAAAHSQGILHRDLKPENLFCTAAGPVKILDFGLAKLGAAARADEPVEAGGPTATADGAVFGTVGYMAPEQVRGLPLDGRSDLFALGVVLHELLTGRRPFRRDTAVEEAAAILNDEPPDLPPSTSPALRQVVRRCLEKAPADRFQSARDLS